MLTLDDKKDISTIITEALEKTLGEFAISVQRGFEEQDRRRNEKFQELKNEMATKEDLRKVEAKMVTKEDLLELREEFSIRYDSRLDCHGDDIRQLKTKLAI